MQAFLTGLLWLLLAGAFVPVAAAAAYFFPIVLLFGRDDPSGTMAGYVFALAVPLLAVVAVLLVSGFCLRLWRTARWKTAAFVLALAQSLAIWLLAARTFRH